MMSLWQLNVCLYQTHQQASDSIPEIWFNNDQQHGPL